MKPIDDNHIVLKFAFAAVMAVLAHLVYHGVRVTLFNIPFAIVPGVFVQHELSLGLWVFGSVTCVVLMVVILDAVRPPRQKMLWKI